VLTSGATAAWAAGQSPDCVEGPTMLSVNVKLVVVVMLMQQSCSSMDFEYAKYLLVEATRRLMDQEDACQQSSGTAIFINPVEKISC
jgi:hypothetical protein